MKFKKGFSDIGLTESLKMFLELAERLHGIDFFVTSAYREGDAGAHGEGLAVDIRCNSSRERFNIVVALTGAGFRRIGIYDRHVHADRSLNRPDKVIWIGESK